MSHSLFRYCPACGVDSLKPDSVKSVVCAGCGFVYFFNSAAAVAGLIVNANNELLVIVRAENPGKGQWDLPGGFVDPGESAEEALRREIKEELNLAIDSMTYFASAPNIYFYKQVAYTTADIAFVCHISDFSALAATDEVETVLFLSTDKLLLEQFAFDSTRTLVSAFIKKQTGNT